MRSGYLFRGRKISRKIQIREYSENFLHAKNTCYNLYSTFSKHYHKRASSHDRCLHILCRGTWTKLQCVQNQLDHQRKATLHLRSNTNAEWNHLDKGKYDKIPWAILGNDGSATHVAQRIKAANGSYFKLRAWRRTQSRRNKTYIHSLFNLLYHTEHTPSTLRKRICSY